MTILLRSAAGCQRLRDAPLAMVGPVIDRQAPIAPCYAPHPTTKGCKLQGSSPERAVLKDMAGLCRVEL
jgi:hypothetical protein